MKPSKTTLLLVDDEHDQLTVRKAVLELSGYRVFTAGTAKRALQLFDSHHMDAVILDYDMPGTNGGTLAREIRSSKRATPILLLSGCLSLPRHVLRLVDMFVPKTTPPAFLINAIAALTEGGFPQAT